MQLELKQLLVIALATSACVGIDVDAGGTWHAETERRGDTLIVRTLGGSVWSEHRRIDIDLSIGTLEGSEHTMFGSVDAMAVDAAGGVYVYDRQVPAIRYFDADGTFVRQVGREGEGPGEYRDAVLGMAIRSDGRLEIRDARNGRLTLYDPDGSYSDQWIVSSGLFTSQAMFLDMRDHTYLKILEERPVQGHDWKIGLLHYDDVGNIVETIPDPWIPNPPRAGGGFLSPSKVWTFGWDGSMIVGVNEDYRFEIRRPDGTVTRIERQVTPASVTDAEYDAYEELRAYRIRTQGRFMTTLPGATRRVKPAYRGLYASRSGRIWVQLYGPVEPNPSYEPAREGEAPAWPFIEAEVFDVFDGDGTYLGQVHAPHDVNIQVFGDDAVWGVRVGELGESYVVRGVLVPITGERAGHN